MFAYVGNHIHCSPATATLPNTFPYHHQQWLPVTPLLSQQLCARSRPPRTAAAAARSSRRTRSSRTVANSNGFDASTTSGVESSEEYGGESEAVKEHSAAPSSSSSSSSSSDSSNPASIEDDLKKVVQKTAAIFAPRASVATKNPAVRGSVLYTVFEVQAYLSMVLGGALSFNLIFPSNEPDIWRLMGMWSIWMFTIPSLRASDCSKNEKEALNYLFIVVPLLNILIPFFWKSFAVVWSADAAVFFIMYAWKLGWLPSKED